MKQVEELTDNELQVEISEANGWTLQRDCPGGVLRWVPGPSCIGSEPPDYLHTWLGALTLLLALNCTWSLVRMDGKKYHCWIGGEEGCDSSSDSPFQTICRAWLTMKRGEK
jgi:hypothetical protein